MPDNDGLIVMTKWGGNADADVLSFFSRSGLTDGTQRAAVNTLVAGLKSAGLWSMLYALYPFVGGSAAAHAENLKSASYQITWTNAPTHNANGVTGNGSTTYGICSGLTGNSVVPHWSGQTIYNRTRNNESSGASARYCGICGAAGNPAYNLLYGDSPGFEGTYGNCGSPGISGTDVVNTTQRTGTITISRTSNTSLVLYNNGVAVNTNATNDTSTPTAIDYYVLARNFNGVAGQYSPDNLALYAVHDGMTAAQALVFSQIVAAFQTKLGRNV